MFFVFKPSEGVIQHFLGEQKLTQFSYPHAGESRTGISPTGYVADHNRIQLGSGIESFERAKATLRQWKMFVMAWVELCWPNVPISVGSNVAILISHFGFWSLNAARIVYLLDEQGLHETFGFAYGTLPEHGKRGEERFTVDFHAKDGSVWYDLLAFSRPNMAARLAYPLTRSLQRHFAQDSKLAMKRAVDKV